MPGDAKREEMSELTTLCAEYGVEPFLETTSLLVVLLDQDGSLLSWNPSFDTLKQTHRAQTQLKDFLSTPSKELFNQLLSTTLHHRMRTKGGLEFVGEARNDNFMCLLIPMPGQGVLFIAELVTLVATLEAVTAELQRTKRILMIKETELKAVIAQADEVSHTDALTFLPNRRQIIADLQRETNFSDNYGTPLTISMLDIDHFKDFNDTYGHLTGDKILRFVANSIRHNLRGSDSCGRWGGEEFVAMLLEVDEEALRRVAEKLRSVVAHATVREKETDLGVTISIGASLVRPEDTFQSLMQRADELMYESKQAGRDRVTIGD